MTSAEGLKYDCYIPQTQESSSIPGTTPLRAPSAEEIATTLAALSDTCLHKVCYNHTVNLLIDYEWHQLSRLLVCDSHISVYEHIIILPHNLDWKLVHF